MIRSFFIHLIPFLLPFVLYALYLYFDKRAGGDKRWQWNSVSIALITGLVLTILSFVILGLNSGEPIDGTYIPPRYEDGRIIDSIVIPNKKN
jgi:uncharacterized protein DUF6111